MNIIPVAFASDNNYVMPTIVSITSILYNKHKETFYHFVILDNGITEENKKHFDWPQYQNEYKIQFFPLNLEKLTDWWHNDSWPVTAFGRFFICDILDDYTKCIYLDGDTLILNDLSEFYNINISENYICGVKSPGTNYNVAAGKHDVLSEEQNEKSLSLTSGILPPPENKYHLNCINSGVLVLNLELLRREGGGKFLQEKTLETSQKLGTGKVVTDQDMLNLLFVDRIVYAGLKYNFYINSIVNFYHRHYYPFCFSRKIIEEAFEKPVIIHYALPEKPWLYSNAKAVYAWPYKFSAGLWHDYYAKSPLCNKKLKGKRLSPVSIIWYHLKPILKQIKPILKQNRFLLKIRRHFTKRKILSPIQDFLD